ncbi:MAG: hypothetical protein HYX94_04990 [Chloroflexi bacterium]|nr:hypothetical protein [Chloroflexota bacterium]
MATSVLVLAFVILLVLPAALATAAGTVGTGTAESCTEAAFTTALWGGGLVMFNCGASPVTITVTSQKSIALDTTVDGGSLVTLSGGGTTRVFDVQSGAGLMVSNLTLRNGHMDTERGGSIRNSGTLSVSNVIFNHNNANGGGAIDSTGTSLSVMDSTFTDNSAGSGYLSFPDEGGAIAIHQGSATVISSTFSTNTALIGGAIRNFRDGRLTVTNSTFSNNSASNDGGAIRTDGTMAVTNSTITGNYSGNVGGGVTTATGDSQLDNTALQSNSAKETGGGLNHEGGTLTIPAVVSSAILRQTTLVVAFATMLARSPLAIARSDAIVRARTAAAFTIPLP